MNKTRTGLCVMLCMIVLSACSRGDNTAESTVAIDKKGKITGVIVEEFAQEYYDEEDLKNYTLTEAAAYNAEQGEGTVTLSKIEVKDEQVIVEMEYASGEDYAAFNGKQFFAGTVAEAYESGYSLDVTLKNVAEPDKTIGKSEILEMGEKHIIIAEENIVYKLPSKALYISQNDETLKNTVVKKNYSEQESMLYIIY